jgi:hypothetical protein
MITKRGGKILFAAVCLGALNTRIQAVVDGNGESKNPYSAIWQRNAFDLKSAAAEAVEAPKTNLPPPNVQLTGITTILGNKRALFMVQESASPGKPPGRNQSFILTEGERQGVLEVLEINTKAATVKIRNNGILSTIALTTNKGVAETASSVPVVTSQGVTSSRGFMRPMGFVPGAVTRQQPPAGAFAPQGNYPALVSQGGYGQSAYQGGFQTGYTQPPSGMTPAPNPANSPGQSPPVAESSPAPVAANNQAAPLITPEMQAAIEAAEAAAAEGRLTPTPLPPGASVQTAAEARAGVPAPPNFPTPPPLPMGIMNSIR